MLISVWLLLVYKISVFSCVGGEPPKILETHWGWRQLSWSRSWGTAAEIGNSKRMNSGLGGLCAAESCCSCVSSYQAFGWETGCDIQSTSNLCRLPVCVVVSTRKLNFRQLFEDSLPERRRAKDACLEAVWRKRLLQIAKESLVVRPLSLSEERAKRIGHILDGMSVSM